MTRAQVVGVIGCALVGGASGPFVPLWALVLIAIGGAMIYEGAVLSCCEKCP